jgi:hypothetical protein
MTLTTKIFKETSKQFKIFNETSLQDYVTNPGHTYIAQRTIFGSEKSSCFERTGRVMVLFELKRNTSGCSGFDVGVLVIYFDLSSGQLAAS